MLIKYSANYEKKEKFAQNAKNYQILYGFHSYFLMLLSFIFLSFTSISFISTLFNEQVIGSNEPK